MLNKKLLLLFVLFLLALSSLAFAQGQEIKDYKVQHGDTLWDISKKELKDPFLWPKIWKENPEITNPDKLVPGGIIKLPLYLIQQAERTEEPVPVAEPVVKAELKEVAPVLPPEAAPVKVKPLVDVNLLISSGYITGSLNELGRITGSPSGKTLLGVPDMVYVKTKGEVKIGDRFYVLRKGQIVKHPLTNKILGNLVEISGIAEIRKFESGETVAQIIRIFSDVNMGDILDTYIEMSPPAVSKPYRRPDIKGYIVEARHYRIHNSMYDIVYIDKGKNDGLETGDILKTVTAGKNMTSTGLIQIINVMESTSTAIVRSSTDSITKGNLVTTAQ